MSEHPVEDDTRLTSAARWGRGRYLLTWGLLFGAQLGTLWSMAVVWDGGPERASMYGLGVLLMQAMKLVPTLGRLRDLGRPPDDALWTFVPLMNLALWTWMLGPTPTERRWQARRHRWVGRLQALPAYGLAWRRLVAVPVPAAVALGVLALGEAGVAGIVDGLLAAEPDTRTVVGQASSMLAIVAGLYAAIQLVKRKTASPASWGPAWLVVPFGMMALALSADPAADAGGTTGLLILLGIMMGTVLSLGALAYGVAMAVWIPALERDAGHEVPPVRWGAVVAASLGRSTVVQLGMQVVLPGVWFAISWSFAEIMAVRNPEDSPFRASAGVAKTRRSTILKVLLVWGLGSTAGSVISLPMVGMELWGSAFVGAAVLPPMASFVESLGVGLVTLLCVAALRELVDDTPVGEGEAGA